MSYQTITIDAKASLETAIGYIEDVLAGPQGREIDGKLTDAVKLLQESIEWLD